MLQQSKPTFAVGNGVDAFQYQFFLTFPEDGRKGSVPIHGFQLPILFRNKILYFQLAVYNQCQRRRLHTTDGQHLTVLSVLQRVEAGGVHAEQPVTDGTAQSGNVKRLVFALVFQLAESLPYRLVRH